ncbi:MAG: AraC family transcriptional regulator [Firmicutes bacterium HGW-Firmicutes-3]|jgi:AraC-like DNA-binding protein|nr:MAG: AraC family transcriptional regulator [Firmicutes bacterium HGW-Firmicutes-3]
MGEHLFNIFPNERFIDLNLFQYGWEQCIPSQSFGPHIRNHYLFHFVISGAGTLFSMDSKGNNHVYHITSNQGYLICPNQTNTYVADENYPWEYAWIEFDGLRVRELLNLAGLTVDSPVYRSIAKDLTYELINELLYIVKHSNESPFHLIGHLYLALDLLARSSANKSEIKNSKLADFYVHEALTFIEQNFQNDISVNDISQFCNLNRSYFGKIFRNAVGSSPQDFLINYRMSKASELLRITELHVCDISKAVGYPNQLHFSRAFKNVYGISPTHWRNKNLLKQPKNL